MQKSTDLLPEICSIHFANKNDVASITTGSDYLHKVVTFKSGKTWEQIYTAPASKEFTEEQKEHDAGPFWEQKLSLFYPGDNAQVRANFNNYGNKRLLIKLVFHNGDDKLLGDLSNPVKAFHKFDLNKAGHVVTFECKAIQQAFMLD